MKQFSHPDNCVSMGWPVLNYSGSEEETLENVRSSVCADVGVVLLEPVHWQTGERMSSSLISQIGMIAHENEALLVVDETNTGCGATGEGFWAYDGSQADYVSFGKRTQVTGFFSAMGPDGITLGGSEHDVTLLGEIKKQIDADQLIERVARVGNALGI